MKYPIPDNLYSASDFAGRLSDLVIKSGRSSKEWAAAVMVTRRTFLAWMEYERCPGAINVRAIVLAAKKFGFTNITTDWLLSMCDYKLKYEVIKHDRN